MKHPCIVLLLFSLCFISCTTLEPVSKKQHRAPLTIQALSNLNGNYDLFSVDSTGTTLDRILWLKSNWWPDKKEKYTVSLKAMDDRRLQVSVYKNGELMDTRILKGKVQNGSFVIKKNRITRFYLLQNSFDRSHIRIGVLYSGDLIIDSHRLMVVTLVFLPVAIGRDEQYDVVFRRQHTIQ